MKTSDNARAEFDRKLERAREELAATGMLASNDDHHIDRLLRRLGLRLRPPHYRDPIRYGLGMTVYFTLAMGAFMRATQWPSSAGDNLVPAIIAVILFGVGMAAIMAHGRRKHRLSRWDDL